MCHPDRWILLRLSEKVFFHVKFERLGLEIERWGNRPCVWIVVVVVLPSCIIFMPYVFPTLLLYEIFAMKIFKLRPVMYKSWHFRITHEYMVSTWEILIRYVTQMSCHLELFVRNSYRRNLMIRIYCGPNFW